MNSAYVIWIWSFYDYYYYQSLIRITQFSSIIELKWPEGLNVESLKRNELLLLFESINNFDFDRKPQQTFEPKPNRNQKPFAAGPNHFYDSIKPKMKIGQNYYYAIVELVGREIITIHMPHEYGAYGGIVYYSVDQEMSSI